MKYFVIIILVSTTILFPGCYTDSFTEYADDNGIYFAALTEKRPVKIPRELKYYYKEITVDSIRYSFKMDEYQDEPELFTAWLKVKINGVAPKENLTYRLAIDATSTAVEGVHFDRLEKSYVFHAGQYVDSLAVVFHKDAMPAKGSVRLGLKLVTDNTLTPVIQENNQLILNVSNDYFKPSYWDSYVDFNLKYFHPLKIQKMWEELKTKKVAEWRMTHSDEDWNVKVGGNCYWYFKNGNILDDNGNRVTVD